MQKIIVYIFVLVILSGCNGKIFDFDSYDYNANEEAKLKIKKSGYSVKVRGSRFYLEKKFRVKKN